jgi:general stress protein 26
MDSINRNQDEENHADLLGTDAVDKIKELVKQAETGFFCTKVSVSDSEGARPMSVQKVDDDGNLWFLSASDSHKNQEIALDPEVTMYFQASAHAGFLELKGIATAYTSKEMIHDLWNPIMKTWFTEGVDDPRITVIQFRPTAGYYWDNKHGSAIAGVKMLIGAAIGKTMDDSIEGKILP